MHCELQNGLELENFSFIGQYTSNCELTGRWRLYQLLRRHIEFAFMQIENSPYSNKKKPSDIRRLVID